MKRLCSNTCLRSSIDAWTSCRFCLGSKDGRQVHTSGTLSDNSGRERAAAHLWASRLSPCRTHIVGYANHLENNLRLHCGSPQPGHHVERRDCRDICSNHLQHGECCRLKKATSQLSSQAKAKVQAESGLVDGKPEQLVRKLVPLIPPPFANLTRFHGVFAPRAKLRERVVAQMKTKISSRPARCRSSSDANEGCILDVLPKRKPKTKKNQRYRLDWASLLSRIFAIDVMTCAQCKGKLRMVAKVDNPGAVEDMLRTSGLTRTPTPTQRR